MSKTFVFSLVIVVFFTIQGFAKLWDKEIAEIDQEYRGINQLKFSALSYPPGDPMLYEKSVMELTHDGISIQIYRDRKSKRVRKVVYSEISQTGESGGFSTYYFNAQEELILLYQNEWVYDLSLTDTPFWKIYFSKGKIIHTISGRLHSDNGRVMVLKALSPPSYFKTIKGIEQFILESCDKKVQTLQVAFKKTTNKSSKRSYNNVIQLYTKIQKQAQSKKYLGTITFSPPVKGNHTSINDMNVLVRAKPSTKSPVVTRLHVGQRVTIQSVGKKEHIADLGTHSWYEVAYYPNAFNDKKITGWVFGAFLEPV